MELEKIRIILAKAPDGATHCTDTVPSMNLYAKVVHLGGFYVSLGNKWEPYPVYAGVHLLSDLQTIIEAKEHIAELEKWIAAIADDHPQIPDWIQQSARSLLAKGGEL
ncbi:hypothetical protein JAO78_005360 [Alishewanella sp. 16-MA]|uniref:Uncharacterized protein n=1 Tax=Alishewanella maricola TaxID=2795740 RepID=A0ABS8C1Q4_9ALTE|nr:hypothetical protein [Alishewanella maricola]MCB5226240.1 hypothetical protein [Alishewanella maricola]